MLATRPKFQTPSGRTVYGGGGIYPDVVIKDDTNLSRLQADMIQKRVFFEFATHYLVRHKTDKFTAQSWDKNFKLADSDWSELRKTMEARKVAVTDSAWTADRGFMMQEVRSELASATVGQTERYRIITEDDTQLNAALDLFPRASKLMSLSTAPPNKKARP